VDDEGDHAQKRQPENKRQADADPPRPAPIGLWQFVRKD
jgi:hypothetical protein